MTVYTLERLTVPVAEADLESLAQLLIDAVDSGAAVSFLLPLPVDRARDWWRQVTANADPRAIFLVARDNEGIVGTVQLHPSWAPNQPHRGDVAKLIVHRRGRGAGLGTELMLTIEEAAAESGFRLLTLDAKRGGAAERLYRRIGWRHAGTIPRYALDTDGKTPHATEIFYKELNHQEEHSD